MTTSVYIHIPFCEHLCSYCDFTKRFYDEEIAKKYLEALKKEIISNYQGEIIKTLYVGGGTPSAISFNNLLKLKEIVNIFKMNQDYEFTFEVNPENIDKQKLELLKEIGVNRISMGVESTNNHFLKYLGRNHDFHMVQEKISLIKKVGIKNINVDLIYALPNQTINDVKTDLDNILKLDVHHISTYSLEIHNNTILGIKKEKNINEDLDSEMYYFIANYLKEKGFEHYEVSNFCKNNHYSYHNLVYWNNNHYYGFGLGASGYVGSIRYENTRNLTKYLQGIYRYNEEKISEKDNLSYALILGFRLIKGINKKNFRDKYHRELIEMYNIKELIERNYLQDDGFYIKIRYDKVYVENNILENFVD